MVQKRYDFIWSGGANSLVIKETINVVIACTVHAKMVCFQLRTKVGVLRRDFRSLERFVKIQLQGNSLWEHLSLGVRNLFTRRRCSLHFCVKVSKEIDFCQKAQYTSSVREMLHILEYACSSLVLRIYNAVSSILQSIGI